MVGRRRQPPSVRKTVGTDEGSVERPVINDRRRNSVGKAEGGEGKAPVDHALGFGVDGPADDTEENDDS